MNVRGIKCIIGLALALFFMNSCTKKGKKVPLEQATPTKLYFLSTNPDSTDRNLYLFTFRGDINYCILVPSKEYILDSSLDIESKINRTFRFRNALDENAFFTLKGKPYISSETMEDRYIGELNAFENEGIDVLYSYSAEEDGYYEITGISTFDHTYLFKSACWQGNGTCRLDAIYPQKDSAKWNTWIEKIKNRGVFCY